MGIAHAGGSDHMTTGADLLLLRLDVLKRGLEDMHAVLEAGKTGPGPINRVRERVVDANDFVSDVALLAENVSVQRALKELLRNPGDGWEREWTNALKRIDRALQAVREGARDIQDGLAEATRSLKDIADRSVSFGEGFGERAGVDAGDLAAAIDSLRDAATEGVKAPGELWSEYFDKIEPEAARLFCGYLDLLGGVSIRERGLAISALADVCQLDELCKLADWHVRFELAICVDWDKAFVALPGHDVVAQIPAWPVVRLGFASWSIWGLSLEGHQFGKLLADWKLVQRDDSEFWHAELQEFGEVGLRLLIADCVGAWAEGPAYACALLFLVLNPNQTDPPPQQEVSDAERARVVLAMLDRQVPGPDARGRRGDGGYGYLPFLRELAEKWTADRTRPDGAGGATGDGGAERAALLRALPERVQKRFRLRKPFGLADWRMADTVLDCLHHDLPIPGELAPGVRHLTNAAWRARVVRSPNAVELDVLEQRALKAGMGLMAPPERPDDRGTDGSTMLKATPPQ